MLVISHLLLTLTIIQAAPAAEQTGRASGRVTLAGSNTPVSGARVLLLLIPTTRPTGPMGPPQQATTDQDGRFGFDRIPPGNYRFDAQKTGLASVDSSRAPTVTIAAGQSLNDIRLQLQKGAAITGKVFDPNGEPLSDARVVVLRRMPMPAGAAPRGLPSLPRLIPVPSPGAQTNDLGEFRVSGLAPDEYFVAVTPRSMTLFGPAWSSPVRDQKAARTTLPTTYYPGTTDQTAAQPIAVAAGAEVGNIFLTMRPVPAFRISGVVVDEDGKPVGDAIVMLMGDPRSGALMGPVGNSTSRADGLFNIEDVPAGSYRANASIMMRMTESGRGGAIGGSAVSWSSTSTSGAGTTPQPVEIVVADADVTGVRVVVRRPNPR
jgi:protocatechuate 3,4-dioxygenase beta subunit